MTTNHVTGNVGMYYAAYRLSKMGWNVMPTARNAKGIDLLAYDADARRYLGIQIKTLSKHDNVPLGKKGPDHLLGDFWIIVCGTTEPECFIMTLDEVRERAVQYEKKVRAYWLPAKQYQTNEFREKWGRIGPGNATDARIVTGDEAPGKRPTAGAGRNVSIGGSAEGSTIVTGDRNKLG
jgi:hypothetical protein